MRSFQLRHSRSSGLADHRFPGGARFGRSPREDRCHGAGACQRLGERFAVAAGDGRRVVFTSHPDMKTQPTPFGKGHQRESNEDSFNLLGLASPAAALAEKGAAIDDLESPPRELWP
jgi:hypothetical protein